MSTKLQAIASEYVIVIDLDCQKHLIDLRSLQSIAIGKDPDKFSPGFPGDHVGLPRDCVLLAYTTPHSPATQPHT
jgi:hypothetical protein